jgi:hypothetical protein
MIVELPVLVAIGPLLTISLLNEAQNQLHRMHHKLIGEYKHQKKKKVTPWKAASVV